MSKAKIVRGRAAAAQEEVQEEAAKSTRGSRRAAPAPEPEAPAPKGRRAAAAPATDAPAPKSRGADRRYKLLVKENPFREGTKRHAFWEIMTGCKTTGEVREQEPLCTTAFFDSLVEREILEYLD
jgi:hypothetical protein